MSEVKRYKMSVVTSATYPKVRSDEDEAGSWVMYDDYAVLESRLAKMREELVELDLLEDAGMALSAQLEDVEDNIIAVCWGHLSESIQKIGDVIRSFIPTDSPLPEAKNADGKLPPL